MIGVSVSTVTSNSTGPVLGPAPRGGAPDRILIIRPSALGDVCRSVQVAASLRAHWPEAVIGWVVQAGFEDAIREHPAVDEVLPFRRKASIIAQLKWLKALRGWRADLVVDAQGLGRSGLMALASGARTRVGWRAAREGAWLAYNRRVRTPADRHGVDRMLDLVAAVGVPPLERMRLRVPEAAAAWWQVERTDRRGPSPEQPYVVLAPTARWGCKEWPAERFGVLARRLIEAGYDVVLVGAPGEEERVAAARPRDGEVHDLCGRTTVGQSMAVVAGAAGVVAGDSAILHMAAGCGVPSVALFGPTEPSLVGARGAPSTVIRHVDPAVDGPIRYRRLGHDDRFMQRIEIDEVAGAAMKMLEMGGGDGPAAASGDAASTIQQVVD